jgi:glycosyltransferase involved in cell wall biosynthesis
MIDILIPTWGRAGRMQRISDQIHRDTVADHRIMWIVEDDDHDSMGAVPDGDVQVINARSRNYAGAINTAFLLSRAEQVFLAADDVVFHPGWDLAALACVDGWFHVIGSNDLLHPGVAAGMHATHYLVDREYVSLFGSGVIDSDEPILLFEGYSHNYTDTEFIGTAKARCRFRPCLDSVVEHRHLVNQKAADDATYTKNQARFAEDTVLYDSRRPLWEQLVR